MDNPETLATFVTQDIGRRQTNTKNRNTTQKTNKINNTAPPKIGSGNREGYAVPASNKTPTILLK